MAKPIEVVAISGRFPQLSLLVGQAIRFGIVGLLATLLHTAVFSTLEALTAITPEVANFLAFLCAVSVSYFGNVRFTFRQTHNRMLLLRFLATALAGYFVNHVNIVLVVRILDLPWPYVLPGMLVVAPALLFITNKIWVFRA